MKHQQVEICCYGVTDAGNPALAEPLPVMVELARRVGCATVIVSPLNCPYVTGAHLRRCRASHPPGVDKVGEGVGCPYSFDYPYIAKSVPDWCCPAELASALEAMSET